VRPTLVRVVVLALPSSPRPDTPLVTTAGRVRSLSRDTLGRLVPRARETRAAATRRGSIDRGCRLYGATAGDNVAIAALPSPARLPLDIDDQNCNHVSAWNGAQLRTESASSRCSIVKIHLLVSSQCVQIFERTLVSQSNPAVDVLRCGPSAESASCRSNFCTESISSARTALSHLFRIQTAWCTPYVRISGQGQNTLDQDR